MKFRIAAGLLCATLLGVGNPVAAHGRDDDASFDQLRREAVERRFGVERWLDRHTNDGWGALRWLDREDHDDEEQRPRLPWWAVGHDGRWDRDWRKAFDHGRHEHHGWQPGNEPFCMPVPEPAAVATMLAGLAALALRRRRRG